MMSKFSRFLLMSIALCLGFTILSCSGTAGSNAIAIRTTPPNLETTDPSLLLEPEGNYNQLLVHPTPYYNHFQNGCIAPGNSTPVRQIDSRLSIGMKYEINYRSLQPTTPIMKTSVQGSVILRTSSTIAMSGTVSSVSNITGLATDFSSIRTCIFDSAKGTLPCTFLPMPAISTPPGTYNECTLSTGKQTSWAITSGIFTTVKGQIVPAYKILTTYTGDIVCDGNNLGPGTVYFKLILSNKVPAENQVNFCGGVRLFDGSSYYLSNGSHIVTVSYEKIKVPVLP